VKCGLCRRSFDAEKAKRHCAGCVLVGCTLVKCPHCGYEQPPEPRWAAWIRRHWGERHAG